MLKIKILSLIFVFFLTSACSKDESVDPNDSNNVNVFDNRQSTGSSAHDILSDNTFTSMRIELVYVEGYEPTETAVNNFISFLTDRIHKPLGISLNKRAITSPGKTTYSIEDIAQIEREQREIYNNGSIIAIWAYFTDGKSDKDTADNITLGTAYWNTSFVIFEETLRGLSNSPLEPNRNLLETTVINHEFGHLLGLTNLGSPMQTAHEDSEHENHCNVNNCLMYWATEYAVGIGNMTGVPQLDAQCIADLKANGGK
ncbi:membrane metalloprotease [Aestuariivivens sediminis]|uniref:membrane metalloprotease n=1 Tax=Aestuariivivens sediminis TaxID=2913557 RepID=UPI001F566E74|nr:membrane metalloprotease [Aestuariivivens sediminis]